MTAHAEPLELNALEIAILEAMAKERPSLVLELGRLQVQGRRLTGVGSYTDFACDEAAERDSVKLAASIAIPGIRNGMGASLLCRGHRPECLEIFTRGDEFWTGAFDGFSVG
ncbi:MAG TPA: hypothetical protein VHE30_24515 [Polyangiaceae bacterium]|nr:hypothetical protein [Polyangiaceae bacterium]